MPFVNLDDTKVLEPFPGYKGNFVHAENMSLAFWEVKAGADFPEHTHPHEQVSVVTEGEFELTVDGETQVLKPGNIAVIPSNVPHSGRAITDCRIVDAFQPVREDYR